MKEGAAEPGKPLERGVGGISDRVGWGDEHNHNSYKKGEGKEEARIAQEWVGQKRQAVSTQRGKP